GIGLMKTTDGGASWTNIGASSFGGLNVSKVLLDPVNPDIVTVLTTIGSKGFGDIWNSPDGGATWSKKGEYTVPSTGLPYNGANWTDGVVTSSGAYFATGESFVSPYHLYRSTDKGATWAQLPNAPIAITTTTTIPVKGARLAASPVNPNTVYLIYTY